MTALAQAAYLRNIGPPLHTDTAVMPLEANVLEQVRASLAGIEHVERVVVDGDARTVALVCDGAVNRDGVHDRARETLAGAGLPAHEWGIEITVRVEGRERQRVRFVSATRQSRPDHQIDVNVALEWGGQMANARVTSEQGEALELRAVATASLEALRQLVDPGLDVRVGGVKRTRSFDADLMVASLYRAGPPPQQFVGAVMVGDDPLRAASVAVLSALNRHLGNYLLRT